MTRQAKRQRELRTAGCCISCGKPNDSDKTRCFDCRKRSGGGMYKRTPGSVGRPALGQELAWDTVDWTQRPKDIAAQLHCSIGSVYVKRQKLLAKAWAECATDAERMIQSMGVKDEEDES